MQNRKQHVAVSESTTAGKKCRSSNSIRNQKFGTAATEASTDRRSNNRKRSIPAEAPGVNNKMSIESTSAY
jgi:hypothetical protein